MRIFILIALVSCLATAQDSTVVMFLGDSYTEYDFGGGYKPHIFHHLDSLGYLIRYAGRDSMNGASMYFNGADDSGFLPSNWNWPRTQMWHEGVASKQAYHYATGTGSTSPGTVADAVNANLPDVLCIQIGLNDISNGSFSTTTIRNNIDTMLTQAWSVDPTMRIILWNVALTKNLSWYDSINALNPKIATLITTKQQAGYFVLPFDADAATDSTDFDGSSHPSASYGATKWSGGNRVLGIALAPIIATAIDSVLGRSRYLFIRRN